MWLYAVYVVGSVVDSLSPFVPGVSDIDLTVFVPRGYMWSAFLVRSGAGVSVFSAEYPGLMPSPMLGFESVASTLLFAVSPRRLLWGRETRFPPPRLLIEYLDRAWFIERFAAYLFWLSRGYTRGAAKNLLRIIWYVYVDAFSEPVPTWMALKHAEHVGLTYTGCYERLHDILAEHAPTRRALEDTAQYCYPQLTRLKQDHSYYIEHTLNVHDHEYEDKILPAETLVIEYSEKD